MPTFPLRKPVPVKTRRDYHIYREEIREDCKRCCVYCGVHENHWPHRSKNYQLDHFKPKGPDSFPQLRNDFYNLRWCCHICNGRNGKGDNWPTAKDEVQGYGFVDLCLDNWQTHYKIHDDGSLEALTLKARYTIEIIGLNEPDYVAHRLKIMRQGHLLFAPPQTEMP